MFVYLFVLPSSFLRDISVSTKGNSMPIGDADRTVWCVPCSLFAFLKHLKGIPTLVDTSLEDSFSEGKLLLVKTL
jgi:hypothetical protein